MAFFCTKNHLPIANNTLKLAHLFSLLCGQRPHVNQYWPGNTYNFLAVDRTINNLSVCKL